MPRTRKYIAHRRRGRPVNTRTTPAGRLSSLSASAPSLMLILAYVMIPTPVRLISDASAPLAPAEAPIPAAPTTAGVNG